ncbi:hypothetical protein ScPMuIL_006860 [Solemya velum]
MAAEKKRLKEDKLRTKNWKRFGPYLSERQWGTVREDYSSDGNCWDYFPHDHARSRAYDGERTAARDHRPTGRICVSLALWKPRTPRNFERTTVWLTGHQGNHGEDVKELYYYLDSTPTHSYMKALYKYPQQAYPYSELVHRNARRTVADPEYELSDTGIFNEDRYFDVMSEYCKSSPNDILCRYTITNRGSERAIIHVMPTLWFRNTWAWGEDCDAFTPNKPSLHLCSPGKVKCDHPTLDHFFWEVDAGPDCKVPEIVFTENETNYERLYGCPNKTTYVKDGFHRYIIKGENTAVNPKSKGRSVLLTLYFASSHTRKSSSKRGCIMPKNHHTYLSTHHYKQLSAMDKNIARQGYAGLLWSKQFYYYVLKEWLRGDETQPPPPHKRQFGRNSEWIHLFNRDIISMPDKWEYPWYASWDLAFHMIPFANIDIHFAKEQLILFLREWFMHPNGQIPAYEFAFDDVNPPVHAYAVLKVYKASGIKGQRDLGFLARCFHKLVINFTWWINRKDLDGKNIFSGGFLGLDNIGVFDRSKPLPTGGFLAQADATAWMAFFCAIMLEISLTLARREHIYEDMASKFFEHFVAIVDAMNRVDGVGLWNEKDGFYYDHVRNNSQSQPLKILSMVGLVPLFSCLVLKESEMKRHPGFNKRTKWFLEHRKDLASRISFMCKGKREEALLLAILKKNQLVRVLHIKGHILNENEFLSPHGIRSLSKHHRAEPFVLQVGSEPHSVRYEPGESQTKLFGGNSNWRGPIWLPMNYLLIENLQRYDYFYGESLKVECPTGSRNFMRLRDVAKELSRRLSSLFQPDINGYRPCHGVEEKYAKDPHFKDLVMFYEYFHGDNGRGCGASHQTGWTALIVNLLKEHHLAMGDSFDFSSEGEN